MKCNDHISLLEKRANLIDRGGFMHESLFKKALAAAAFPQMQKKQLPKSCRK